MKVLVTGANGFVGKNLIATLKTLEDMIVFEFDRENSKDDLIKFTKECDFVIHLAGVNRPKDISEFYEGNAGFTDVLCSSLKKANNQAPIVISSSIQAGLDNDYGKSKLEGEKILRNFGEENGNPIYIYRFANLYGKWCRPNYNSVIATWCNNVANGLEIKVNDKNTVIPFCYIDDVVEELIQCLRGNPNQQNEFCYVDKIDEVKLGDVYDLLYSFVESRKTNEIPAVGNGFERKLYATYLSYLPKEDFSYELKMNIDDRGSFTEFIKTPMHGQVSINIAKPGIVKGNHWHHTKNEKFLVVSGEGVIRFRRIDDTHVIEYRVSGNKLEVVDIPTGYTHNIENVGTVDLVTVMWANESFDPQHPDTYFMEVNNEKA